MEPSNVILISIFIFIVAILYSSVGHGGASGYLAVLSFFSVLPNEMATTALLLNILVSAIAFLAYKRSGHFSFSFILPFLITSIPAAFIGGMMHITHGTYYLLLAFALLLAALRMVLPLSTKDKVKPETTPKQHVAFVTGSGIGLLSGIVGVGGGIFLSPVLILMKWADPKRTAAVSAFFILINSISGLCGRYFGHTLELGSIWFLLPAAFIGGLIGSYVGANIFSSLMLRRTLGVVLVVAAIKSLLKFLV